MDISIIIPCYNHGHFIDEAIESVLECKDVEYEIIIVNDGSTDQFTIDKLDKLKKDGFKIISHTNKGLGYTRNAGISEAKGKYILPLDADNKIKPDYIYKSLSLLESNKADIVYANPVFFGETDLIREFKSKPFNGEVLFFENYIDACAIYKKDVWKECSGYDERMPKQGHEDWEFWLNAYTKKFRFSHIDEGLYYYRILSNSMSIVSLGSDIENLNYEYIIKKHAHFFAKSISKNYTYGRIYINDMNNPFRSIMKYLKRFILAEKKI